MRSDEIKQEIYKTIDKIVEHRIKEKQRMDYYEGMITQVNKNNTYEVENTGGTLTVYPMNNDTYNRGDIVIVLRFPVYRYILCKKSSFVI